MKDRSDIEAMRVYEDMYDYLKARNCKPKLIIMDNESSTSMKRYITNTNVNLPTGQTQQPSRQCC